MAKSSRLWNRILPYRESITLDSFFIIAVSGQPRADTFL